MDAVLNFFRNMSASERLMWLGNGGMALSVVSTGIFGIQIVEGMNLYVFGAGAIFSLLGWYGTQQDKKRRFDLKMEDAKLREKKIDAGMDPALDKTIIKNWDE